jgi:hypothetical protein
MCALYENYLFNDEDGMRYKSNLNPHCLAKHDINAVGTIIPSFDRHIDRDCHAPSYHKLVLIDTDLRDAVTLEEAYQLFISKYIGEPNNSSNEKNPV